MSQLIEEITHTDPAGGGYAAIALGVLISLHQYQNYERDKYQLLISLEKFQHFIT
jgi:hypothetical protein